MGSTIAISPPEFFHPYAWINFYVIGDHMSSSFLDLLLFNHRIEVSCAICDNLMYIYRHIRANHYLKRRQYGASHYILRRYFQYFFNAASAQGAWGVHLNFIFTFGLFFFLSFFFLFPVYSILNVTFIYKSGLFKWANLVLE